jgi:hypothetical protein
MLCFAGALVSCTLFSCSLDPEAVKIWGGDVTVPALLSLETVSESDIVAKFSQSVSVVDASVTVCGSGSKLAANWTPGDDGKSVVFTVSGTPGIGMRAILSGSVSDGRGDTLSFSVPYTGFNTRPPELRINEIRTSYSKPHVEYIELYAVRAGNLGGVEIRYAGNKDNPAYEFPPAEVKAGEHILYHLRTVEEGLVDETDSLSASAGADTRSDARDFWNNLTRSPLKADNVILLRERKGGRIMDAVLLASAKLTDWPTDALRSAAAEAVAAGAWKPGSLVTDAVPSDGMAPTMTLGRDAASTDTDCPADWALCATRKCSPGAANPAR